MVRPSAQPGPLLRIRRLSILAAGTFVVALAGGSSRLPLTEWREVDRRLSSQGGTPPPSVIHSPSRADWSARVVRHPRVGVPSTVLS